MNPNSLLHLLNLDAVGGVEELFTHFLEASENYDHHILVTGKKPHPFFQKRLAKYKNSLTLEKYFCGIKIPPLLREERRKKAILSSNAKSIILWNRLESPDELKKMAPSSQIVYYEHGASWIESKNSPCRAYLKSMDKIIANSHAAKRLLELKWGIESPIVVLENPLKSDIPTAKEAKKFPTTRPLHLGYIGRLIPLKGISLLLHAIRGLPFPVTLSIAGDGDEKEHLQQEAKRLQIDSFVHFIGCIQDVHQFYSKIDILIVPSIREPLGLVAQEAALCGCPVIASLVDGLPEVVINDKTGYLIPPTLPIEQYSEFGGKSKKLPDTVYDPISDTLAQPRIVSPAAIANSIKKLANDPDTYEKLSRQALEFAQKRPNIIQYTKTLLHLVT